MKKISLLVMMLMLAITSSLAATKVAYFINTTYKTYIDGCTLDTDPVLLALKENFDVTVLDNTDEVEIDAEAISSEYDVAVISEAMAGDKAYVKSLKNLVGLMPVISMKAYAYTSGRWGWAKPANPSTKPTTGITVQEAFRGHALFKGVEMDANGTIELYGAGGNSNNVQGFTTLETDSPIDLEQVLAVTSTDATINTIHEFTMNDKKYVLVPLSSDNLELLLPAATQIIVNAVNYVSGGGSVELPTKIAYLYDSSKESYDVEADPIFAALNGSDDTVEPIDIKEFTSADTDTINALESNYDLVVVSETPGSTHKFASSLKGMINRVPMLNMKSFFYKSSAWDWGAGVNFDIAPYSITLTEAGEAHEVFGNLGGAGDEIELYDPADYTGNIIQGYTVTEGSAIASDDVLATVGGGTFAIHEHGKTNKYMLFPYSADAAVAGVGLTDDGMDLLLAIVDYLADTKTKVRPAGKPTISLEYANALTTVTITGLDGATIYYTLDGTEPTTSSLVYTEPLTFTENAVVKAFVVCQGYNDSDVASAEVVVKGQWAVPTISVAKNADNSVITLTAEDGATVYFNFNDDLSVATSQAYTEPITLTWPATITAFVSGGNNIDSESVSEYVSINSLTSETIRLDTLAHFDANSTDWFLNDTENGSGEAKAYYFNGKNAWNYYGTEVDFTEPALDENGEQIKTEDDRDSVITHYKPDPAALKVFNPLNENGWVIKSLGQVLTLEGTLDTQVGVGNGVAGRYAETAMDAIGGAPTKGAITFGGKVSGDPYTGSIETTAAYAGPFDVLVAVGNGNGSGKGILEVQTSADGTTWSTLDTLNLADTQRYYKRTRLSYNESAPVYVRVAQTGGGSKAQVYDILLLNNGETSKEYDPNVVELPTVVGSEVVAVQIYNAAGAQLNQLGKGLNIVRKLHADGTIQVLKVMGK